MTGALIGQETESGFVRGAAVGAISGAVFSIEVFESSLLLWQSDESGILCLLYLIDVIASLLSGRLVRERIGPAMLSAVQSQMGAAETTFEDVQNIFDTGSVRGLAGDLVEKIPKITIRSNDNADASGEKVSCSVCLQDFQSRETVRRLPQCHHMFHLPCIDKWLLSHVPIYSSKTSTYLSGYVDTSFLQMMVVGIFLRLTGLAKNCIDSIVAVSPSEECLQCGGLKAEKLKLRYFKLEELEKATENFSADCLLGSGAFGNVYKGSFEGEGTFAIKRAHVESYQTTEEFRNEVRLLSTVNHPNLVGLVGFSEESGPKGAKILVYEYVPHGSLLEYIIGRGGRNLTWRQRVNIAIGAAKGIAHLHDGIKPSIIHRDIKPSNILIGERFEAKVSDFGLVKMGPIGDQSHVSSQVKGTPGYLDPAYCTSFHLSSFSDVYSFGVILLQLISGQPAVDTTRNHIIGWARPSIERGNIEEILDTTLLSKPCNMEMMLKMGELGLRCVAKTPKDRPTMTQVWQELENTFNEHPSLSSKTRTTTKFPQSTEQGISFEQDCSQSFVSIDGVGFQKFHIELDSISSQSNSLRCFEINSASIGIDKEDLKF
ncbi:hypothetical protein GOBAR_DD35273 [Gossypium barbadense]|nr:hypothetical protein GOBAR_DD35273 [Gossypium barbadense]